MVRLTDRPDMTLDVYRGRKTTMQQQQQQCKVVSLHKVSELSLLIRYLTRRGWSGGAMVLGKLPVLGRPTI